MKYKMNIRKVGFGFLKREKKIYNFAKNANVGIRSYPSTIDTSLFKRIFYFSHADSYLKSFVYFFTWQVVVDGKIKTKNTCD